MKRFLIGCGLAAVVVAVALGVGPVWTGAVAERHHERALEFLEREPQVRVVSSDYDRGYRSATSRVEVELLGAAADDFAAFMEHDHGVRQPPVLVFHDRVNHGPIPAGSGGVPAAAFVQSRVEVAPDLADLPLFAGDATVMTADTRIAFDGSSRMAFATPAWDVEIEHTAFSFTGLEGTFKTDADMTSGEIEAAFDRLTLTEFGSTWAAQGVRLQAAPEDLGALIWTGDSVLEVDSVGVDDAEVEGLRIESWAGLDDGAMDITMDATVHGAVAGGYRIDESRFKAALHRIDHDAMEQLVALGDDLELGHIDEHTMGMRFLSLVPQLLEREPEFIIEEFTIAMPEGPFEASASIAWQGPVPSLEDAFSAINGLSAEMTVGAPREALHQSLRAYLRYELETEMAMYGRNLSDQELDERATELASQRVDAMVGEGVLQRQGQDLHGHLQIEDGLILINGKNYGPVWALLAQ